MADWYGPEDAWPRHPEPWWRDALKAAQKAGWWLEYSVGKSRHTWGKLRCTRTDNADVNPCTARVDSSGKGAENVANDIPKRITRCPHREADPTTPDARMARARERLQDAEVLLTAVEGVLDQRGALEDAEQMLLEAFDMAADDVERYVDQAGEKEAEAFERLSVARTELATIAGGSSDAVEGLAAADGRLREAQEELAGVPPKIQSARQLKAVVERLRRRADRVRARLGS